jgi:hypothetical protein
VAYPPPESPLGPTMEAVEASAPAADVEQWLARMTGRALDGVPKLQPKSISLDGSWYSIELNSAGGRFRYDWYSVELDATPVDASYQQLAAWYEELRDWLDSRLEATPTHWVLSNEGPDDPRTVLRRDLSEVGDVRRR